MRGQALFEGGSLSLTGLSGCLYLVISFVLNETVSFVNAPAFVSCHMPIYEELLFEGHYGVKGRLCVCLVGKGGLHEWCEGVKGWGRV